MFFYEGVPKPANADQPVLIRIVVGVVKKMISAFNSGDVIYVRSLRNSKAGVMNVECRSIAVAQAVKSTFAGLVKSTHPPSYLKNVSWIVQGTRHFCANIKNRIKATVLLGYRIMFCLSFWAVVWFPLQLFHGYLLFCYFPGFNLLLSQSRYESSVVSNAICFKASEASWSGVDLFRDIIYSPSINEVKRQSVLLFIILWFDVS